MLKVIYRAGSQGLKQRVLIHFHNETAVGTLWGYEHTALQLPRSYMRSFVGQVQGLLRLPWDLLDIDAGKVAEGDFRLL